MTFSQGAEFSAGDLRKERTTGLIDQADVVYFMMAPGWKTELRGNRWHYAVRWARHLPVVLVQSRTGSTRSDLLSEDEPRIANCRILYVCDASQEDWQFLSYSLAQSQQIVRDMQQHGYSRPIFWTYWPQYICTIGFVPALAHVFHATENYFDFPMISNAFLNRLKTTLSASDLVFAVSEGVAKAYRPYARTVQVVTNGCDYRAYASPPADTELAGLRKGYVKIAVYAGNINARLDFDLLLQTAITCVDTLFIFCGPVSLGSDSRSPAWDALLNLENTRYFGPVHPDRLPAIYGSSDVGLMPYVKKKWMVENGFPLKTFEMLATGLPVVSTQFKPLERFDCPALVVAKTDADFTEAVQALSRNKLSTDQKAALEDICRSQDYDAKFEEVYGLVDGLKPVTPWSDHLRPSIVGFAGINDTGSNHQPKFLKSKEMGELVIQEIANMRASIRNVARALRKALKKRLLEHLYSLFRKSTRWIMTQPVVNFIRALLRSVYRRA